MILNSSNSVEKQCWLFDYLLGGAGAVGVGSNLEVHILEWLGALNASEVVVAITPPSAF